MANKINVILLMPPPHLTTGLLLLDLYSDLESRFWPMQPRKPAQDTLSHTGRMELCHFSAESQNLLQNYNRLNV